MSKVNEVCLSSCLAALTSILSVLLLLLLFDLSTSLHVEEIQFKLNIRLNNLLGWRLVLKQQNDSLCYRGEKMCTVSVSRIFEEKELF